MAKNAIVDTFVENQRQFNDVWSSLTLTLAHRSGKVHKIASAEMGTLAREKAIDYTHVLTGSLQSAYRLTAQDKGHVVHIDPGAENPTSQTKPAEYGVYEHARGGDHAFYGLVYENDRDAIADRGVAAIIMELEKII